MALIKIPAALRQKLGEDGTDAFIDVLDEVLKQSGGYAESNISRLATKEDITTLERRISNVETTLTWRVFLFWVGQVGVLYGLIKLIQQ